MSDYYYVDIEWGRVGIYRSGKCVLRLPGTDKDWDEGRAGPRLADILAELQPQESVRVQPEASDAQTKDT